MFVRKVAARLKPNALPQFTNLMDRDILPWLRKQEGFRDLIILALPDGREIATLSFWDHEQNAEIYNAHGYPEVLKLLEDMLDGKPYVKTFEVVSSTLQRLTVSEAPDALSLQSRAIAIGLRAAPELLPVGVSEVARAHSEPGSRVENHGLR